MYLTFVLDILFNQNLLITFETQDMEILHFNSLPRKQFQKL